MLLFLGSFRTTVIAAVAIPTSIIATFALMNAMGLYVQPGLQEEAARKSERGCSAQVQDRVSHGPRVDPSDGDEQDHREFVVQITSDPG